VNRARATALAIQCLEAEIKRLVVNANLHDQYGADSPARVEASKRRNDLRQAIETLLDPTQERMKV